MTKSERTKQAIIEKASTLFNQQGISGTTVDDVLKAAKVARGCLYNYFTSKDDLSNQTADYLLERITGQVNRLMIAEKTAKGKLIAYLDYNSRPLDTYIEGGCPIFNLAVEADDNHPVIKQKVRDVILASQQRFVSILKQGIADGEFSDSLNPEDFAFKIFAYLEGATVICRVLGTSKPMLNLIKDLKAELETYSRP